MKTKEVHTIAAKRAAWNRNGGGVLLTAELTANNQTGVHWRVLVDGGNYWHGCAQWVAGRAHGDGYDVRGAAMAEAVRGVCGVSADLIDWNTSPATWRERLAPLGWTLYYWGSDAVALIPSEEVAVEILKANN